MPPQRPDVTLINPNSSAEVTRAMVAIAAATWPEARVLGLTAQAGPAVITTPEALREGERAVLDLARGLSPGAQGVIVAGFGDPGLAALRAALALPVTGLGEASLLEAAAGGRRYGIVTTTPGLDASIRAQVAASGTAGQFIGCHYTAGDPLHLSFQPEALRAALALALARALDAGAQAVIIGGGPLAQAARGLAMDRALPVVEPVPAAMRRLRRLMAGRG